MIPIKTSQIEAGPDVAMLETKPLGVYVLSEDNQFALVHAYQEGEYVLEDVFELFGFGAIEEIQDGINAVRLTQHEIRQLKVSADAYSFDYDEEFIEMCLALHRYAQSSSQDQMLFVANFA